MVLSTLIVDNDFVLLLTLNEHLFMRVLPCEAFAGFGSSLNKYSIKSSFDN